MDMHYCDIFTDCYHCPVPFCPYEKLEDGTAAGVAEEYITDRMDELIDELDEDEGW